jgi:hypothetical protein
MKKIYSTLIFTFLILSNTFCQGQAKQFGITYTVGAGHEGQGVRLTYILQGKQRWFSRFDLTYMKSKTGLGLGSAYDADGIVSYLDYKGLTLLSIGYYLTKPQRFRPYIGSNMFLDFVFSQKPPANGPLHTGNGYLLFSPYIGFNFFTTQNLAIHCEYRVGTGELDKLRDVPDSGAKFSISDFSIGLFYTIYKE